MTETSDHVSTRRRGRLPWTVVGVIALVMGIAGCGGYASTAAKPGLHGAPASSPPSAFSWLRPAGAPPGWMTARTQSGATLAYPPGWHKIETDRGTASAAPARPRGSFVGYLNATPLSGRETLANWSRFRVAHVAEEGAHDVRLAAAATGLRLRTGRGSCVIDTYSTSRTRFREIACIVAGAHTTTVVVAAAPQERWARQAAVLERAVSSFAT